MNTSHRAQRRRFLRGVRREFNDKVALAKAKKEESKEITEEDKIKETLTAQEGKQW